MNIPLFNETGVWHGRLHLSCKDNFTFQWLQSDVANITLSSSDNAEKILHLQLVSSAEVRKLHRVKMIRKRDKLINGN